jgi:hypothetical protein
MKKIKYEICLEKNPGEIGYILKEI